ncbi:hypothetical protein GCM10022224_036760 [Nonomuraea antimicrobica]|uniref:SMI1/KNR4 family protein n=1 Tax=Nonomuraea antimicrobica TaxID=561173 RepID=A0ABP7BX45_9ACTN
MPTALAEVAHVGFEWEWDEETEEAGGCDFEPFDRFQEPDRAAWWFRLWTGNQEVDGSEFRFFGKTGAGDYVGFWLVRPDAAIIDQPVVYIGSEGEHGVVAGDLGDLLWLFAAGLGPAESFWAPDSPEQPNETFRAIAERHAPGRRRVPVQIVTAARTEFPQFPDLIDAMCR